MSSATVHELPYSLSRSFAADQDAPAAARRALQTMTGHVDAELVERGRLVVTELVTNSVRHARLTTAQQIGLRASGQQELLWLEVSDDGDGFDLAATTPARGNADGGWGLRIVAELTDRWGVDLSHSTRVWCEFITRAYRESGHGQ